MIRVARLTLARPNELNAVNPDMIEEVIEALASVSAMEEVKALVVSGEGRAFCAGADLTYMEGILRDREALSAGTWAGSTRCYSPWKSCLCP